MNPESNTPKLRFKEFTGEWQVMVLGAVGSVSMCKRIFKEQTSESGLVPFYKIGTFGKTPDAFIDFNMYELYKDKYPFPNKGDILISAAGTIGRLVIYNGEPAYFQDSNIVWVSNNETKVINRFLYLCYLNTNWRTEDTTIARLYNDNLRKVSITVPSLQEQEKIADFLTAVDEKIAKLGEKKAGFEKYKKGVMQAVFSQKIRFKKPEGSNYPDWEEKKLGELVSIKTGKKDVNQGNENGKYPFFTCAREHTYSDSYSFEGEAILIAGNGEVGNCSYYDGKFEAYQRTYVLQDFNLSGKYLYIYLKNAFQEFAGSQKQQGSMPYIKLGTLQEFVIPVQCNEEQVKITEFLASLNNKIGLINKELEGAKKFKKALLQQMFV